MNYFKNKNNEIFAYTDEDVEKGYGKDLTSITEAEKDELLAPTAEELAKQAEAEAKQAKLEALNSITVEVNGNTFDGNESARNNMLSAIQSSDFLGVTETEWKMADNSIVLITLDELKQALALSIQAVGAIVRA